MAKCGDCLYFVFCKKYIDPEETFPEIGGCHTFKSKDAFVEVVRCKDCKGMNEDKFCVAWEGFVREDDFCSYGERREGE